MSRTMSRSTRGVDDDDEDCPTGCVTMTINDDDGEDDDDDDEEDDDDDDDEGTLKRSSSRRRRRVGGSRKEDVVTKDHLAQSRDSLLYDSVRHP